MKINQLAIIDTEVSTQRIIFQPGSHHASSFKGRCREQTQYIPPITAAMYTQIDAKL